MRRKDVVNSDRLIRSSGPQDLYTRHVCQTGVMLEWAEVEITNELRLRIVASGAGIRSIEFDSTQPAPGRQNEENAFIVEAVRQLRAYFTGDLRNFQIQLDLEGTAFQKSVWKALETIPYGETRSYSEIAVAIGSPKAVRAVGAANGANPAPIVVPCHRVIGSSGKLVGYGGGLPLKRRLLEMERAPALFS
jgi:methylated-DNA-[protein]-cysteine S-methyltransferase